MAMGRLGGGRGLVRYLFRHSRQLTPSSHILSNTWAIPAFGLGTRTTARMDHRFSSRSLLFSTTSAPSPGSEKKPEIKSASDDAETEVGLGIAARAWARVKLRELRQELRMVPPLARTLGLAGAIPFVALSPPLVYILPLPDLLYSSHIDAQAAYGAVILSFLGGPHWGLAMADYNANESVSFSGLTTSTARYVWSVTPCLLGWFALLLPPVSRFSILIPSFALALILDFLMAKSKLLPTWYLPLRIFLTGIAILSMGSSLLFLAAKKIPQTLQQHATSQSKE